MPRIFRAREVGGEFEALGFAAGKRGGGLAEAEIAEANFVEDAKLGNDLGNVDEEGEGFADGHAKNVVDIFAVDSELRGRCF